VLRDVPTKPLYLKKGEWDNMKYVIIGNSAAAIGAIEGIRSVDKTGEIVIISNEKYHTYSRPLISYWLEGKVTEEKMLYRKESFYDDNNCKTMFGKTATKIDAKAKTVEMADGEKVSYDKLCIATGSKPFVPPMNGLDSVKSKFTFMSLDEAKAVKSAVAADSRVLIIGAGLIGLKAAEALHKVGCSLTVVDLADRVLPSILDNEGSAIMQKHIESKGVRFILGTSVDTFNGNTATLKTGESIEFDTLIIAVGVRPNTELVKEAGGEVIKGISTDTKQLTTLPDVYAAGDCTESYDITTGSVKILALLPNAYMQGEVAGINMAGGKAEYKNAIPMNAIGFFGLHIITAGCYAGDKDYVVSDQNSYKRLVVKDGKLIGYILIGDVRRAGIYTSMIKEQIPLETVDVELMVSAPQMMMFSKQRRLEKLGGIKA